MSDLVNLDAERAVVAAVLSQPDTIAALAALPLSGAFRDAKTARVYDAMLSLHERREPATCISVPHEMMALGATSLDEVNRFVMYLQQIADDDVWIADSWKVEQNAKIVLEMARLRKAREGGARLVEAATRQRVDLDALFAEICADWERFSPPSSEPTSHADQAYAVRQEAEARWNGTLDETIVPTGIRELDRMLNGGIRLHEMMVLAGRPGMGKSSVALDVAKRCRSLYVSLEMPWKMVQYRLIAAVAQVPYAVGVSKIGDVKQRDRWLDASEKVEAMPLFIRDDLRTTAAIEAEARRIGAEIVVIDHLGRLGDAFKGNVSTYERMSTLSWRCKEMTLRNPLAVIGLSQLNREVESRAGCLPQLSDLRDSGKIEEDADHVALLYNRAYYAKKGMGGLQLSTDDYIPGTNWERLHLKVVKMRNGNEGVVEMGWAGESMSLHDPDERWESAA